MICRILIIFELTFLKIEFSKHLPCPSPLPLLQYLLLQQPLHSSLFLIPTIFFNPSISSLIPPHFPFTEIVVPPSPSLFAFPFLILFLPFFYHFSPPFLLKTINHLQYMFNAQPKLNPHFFLKRFHPNLPIRIPILRGVHSPNPSLIALLKNHKQGKPI